MLTSSLLKDGHSERNSTPNQAAALATDQAGQGRMAREGGSARRATRRATVVALMHRDEKITRLQRRRWGHE